MEEEHINKAQRRRAEVEQQRRLNTKRVKHQIEGGELSKLISSSTKDKNMSHDKVPPWVRDKLEERRQKAGTNDGA